MAKNTGGRPRTSERPDNRFTQWMDETGTEAKDLAEKLGIAKSSIYRLRDGGINPGLELALKIEKVMGIPPSYWVTSGDKENS